MALEQEQKVNETVKDVPPSSEGKRPVDKNAHSISRY